MLLDLYVIYDLMLMSQHYNNTMKNTLQLL